MRGRLELAVDRKDVAGIDDAELGSTHDTAPGFVIVFELDVLQVLAHGFGHQEVVLQRSDSTVDQIGQFKPTGVLALDDGGSTESEVGADENDDSGRQTNGKGFVVAVADSNTAMPLRRG